MKKTFDFQDRNLELEIAGKSFSVVCDDKLAVRLQAIQAQFKDYNDKGKIQEKSLDEIMDACKTVTDEILGKDAFAKIFHDRKPNACDGVDVVVFLMNSIIEKYSERKKAQFGAQNLIVNTKLAATENQDGLPS